MGIIEKGFEWFECKFEPFKTDSKYSNVVRSIQIQILTIPLGFEAFKYKFETFERDSKHSKVIQSIEMQIRTIWNKFDAFESYSKHSNSNLTFWKGFKAFKC